MLERFDLVALRFVRTLASARVSLADGLRQMSGREPRETSSNGFLLAISADTPLLERDFTRPPHEKQRSSAPFFFHDAKFLE